MPGLQRLADFQGHAAMMHVSEHWKAKLQLRRVPLRRKIIARLLEFAEHAQKIFPEEMRQHEAVVQRGAPAHELAVLRLAPEFCDQRPDQKLLRKAHTWVGRHFQRAEFD